MAKLKLSDIAKDLGVASKDISTILKAKLSIDKKSSNTLENSEVDLVIDWFSKVYIYENLDEYYSYVAPIVEKEEKEEPKAEAPKPEEKPTEEVPADKFAAAKAAAAKPTSGKKSEPKKQDPKPEPAQKSAAVVTVETVEQKDTTVHVDTKGVDNSTVNLDKWGERYDNIAARSQTRGKQGGGIGGKQKIGSKRPVRGKPMSNKVETEGQKMQRLALERARKQQLKILIPDEITVSLLAERLKTNVTNVIKKLMGLGEMKGQNNVIDFDTASLVAEELGAKVEREVVVTIEERLFEEEVESDENLQPRNPVVVVMGHVDHGKTSLLDYIRKTTVTKGEAGGITQHIGAYKVSTSNGEITFLDTPGHEAFTSMRMRGASVTDIAILVVAADDGIMPQTIEAINHAKAAETTIIVAINKIDKPEANPAKIMQELTEHELVPEEWGGDIICVPVSAVTGEGVDKLLESIDLVAEVAELKANPDRAAKGAVIEAFLDKGRGPVATILVQSGTLKTGDVVIAGTVVGRIRAMLDDKGKLIKSAGPSTPVEITGLPEVPLAGDTFTAVANERLARELVEQRKDAIKQKEFDSAKKVTLDNLFDSIADGQMRELPIIIKADVGGSVEAVRQSLEKLTTSEVRVKIIHGAVGAINKSDVTLASATGAIIVGFNVRPDAVASEQSKAEGVELRLYRVIYDAIEDVENAIKGMLEPKIREVALGNAEVREVYKITGVGVIAGCYVTDGKVARSALIRLVRDGIVVCEDKIDSLKRFKDDQKEVAKGYECGIGLQKFNDIKAGDVFESFLLEEYRD